MLRARDLRAEARDALQGKWGVAVAVGFVAMLLTGGLSVTSSSAGSEGDGYLSFLDHRLWIMLLTVSVVILLVAIVIGGAVQMGWCSFHTKLVKREAVRFGNLFDYFHQIWRGFRMNFLMGLFVFLWMLPYIIGIFVWIYYFNYLFLVNPAWVLYDQMIKSLLALSVLAIPGIIASYRYAMVPYLMAEFQDLRVMDAIRESKRLMKGNKWRLFCLNLSFIGWILLSFLTMGIGLLWVTPYQQTAIAVFYLDVTGRWKEEPQPEDWSQTQYINRGPEF